MQASYIRQHAASTVHRVAQNLYLCPDRPVSELLPYSLKDQALFGGNIPQPEHWLRAWSACKNVTSFRVAVKQLETEDYASGRAWSVKARSALPSKCCCVSHARATFNAKA